MRSESVNDQGVKIKNHKFWAVKSPSVESFSLAPKVVQTLPSALNDVSKTSLGIFSTAKSYQTKLYPFMQMPPSKQISRQHEMILCILM